MKRKIVAILALVFVLAGCGGKEIKPLSSDDLDGLSVEEQADAIVDNIGLVEEYEIVLEDNSAAIIYAPNHTHDTTLVLSDDEKSFPNVAMLLAEHLSVLDFDELVINSYTPRDVAVDGTTRVSTRFTKDTIDGIDFEGWKETRERRPQRFYKIVDSYIIRGMVWEKLDEETQDAIGENTKNELNTNSDFWEWYGRDVK